jgi:hypothetical protein
MNEEVMKAMGFSKEIELKENGQCPFCGVHIGLIPFRDESSRKEFAISGLCQKCQDAVFGKD